MAKNHIEAFARGQFNALLAKDNKDRLRFTVAGCKDGHLYDHSGTFFGLFDENAPDTEWITPKDLELKRIAGVKLESIVKKANTFFAEFGDGLAKLNSPETEEPVEENEPTTETPVEENEPTTETPVEEDEIDYTAVEKACKKAIKKEDIKKATKLLAKLEGQDCHKKLTKKLGKLL